MIKVRLKSKRMVKLDFNENRIKRIKEKMGERSIDVLVLMKPKNTFYISDFNGYIYSRPIILVLPLENEPILIVPFLRYIHAQDESLVKDIRIYMERSIPGKKAEKDPFLLLKDVLREFNVDSGCKGIEDDYLTIPIYHKLKETFPDSTFTDVSDIFNEMRIIKDKEEISRIRTASKLTDVGMEEALKTIEEGKTDRDVCLNAVYAMRKVWSYRYDGEVADFGGVEGSGGEGLRCTCNSGIRINRMSDGPSLRKMKKGEFVIPIVTAIYKGYHSENERTIILGKPNNKQEELFNLVLKARQEAMDMLRPGVMCSEIDKIATEIIKKSSKYAYYTVHRTGHSIGLGGHEKPNISEDDNTLIQQNMVVAIEPGIYHDKEGGIRHSDTILITSNGCEILTNIDRGLLTK